MADRGRWGATAAVVLELVLAAVGVGVACLAFGPYFAGSSWLLVTLGAVVTGVALAVAGAAWRWPAWLLAPVGLVGLFLYALLALRPWPPSPATTAQDLLSGWDRMLTVALPADPGPEVLALPVAAGFVAAYVVALLVLRTSAVLTLCLPALGVLLLALAVTAARGVTQLPVTVGVLACLAAPRARAGQPARPRGRREPGRRRRARARRRAGQGRRRRTRSPPAGRPRWAGWCSACRGSPSSSRSPRRARCSCRSPTAPTGRTPGTPTRRTCRSPPACPRWSS